MIRILRSVGRMVCMYVFGDKVCCAGGLLMEREEEERVERVETRRRVIQSRVA